MSDKKVTEDLAQLLSGLLGTAAGASKEFKGSAGRKFDAILSKLNLVRREEFDVVRQMAIKARLEVEDLNNRIAVLEGKKPKQSKK